MEKYLPLIKEDLKKYKKRVDFTKQRVITIDGEDAKDLDDAICVERLSQDEFKLSVHIADVSHYVLENSNIDNGTTNIGSSLGKFKNSDELIKAYTNLEKEFTKKCQKIKELENSCDNEKCSQNSTKCESVSPEENGKDVSYACVCFGVHNCIKVAIKAKFPKTSEGFSLSGMYN